MLRWDKWHFNAVLYTQGIVLISQQCLVANAVGNSASVIVTSPSRDVLSGDGKAARDHLQPGVWKLKPFVASHVD